MRQQGEPSVEEILESIKRVIARDNRETAHVERRRRESAGIGTEMLIETDDNELEDEILDLGEAAEMAEPGGGPALTTEGKPLKDYVEAFERMLIDNTMRRHKGSIVAVMEELCLPRRTLNEKMAKYGLTRGDYV